MPVLSLVVTTNRMRNFTAFLSASPCDAFALMAPRREGDTVRVTVFAPGATSVSLCDGQGEVVGPMVLEHPDGIYCGKVRTSAIERGYRFAVAFGERVEQWDDTYRFPSMLSADDTWLFAEGRHDEAYRFMGAHPREFEGVRGVHFVLWAPNARRVSIVGDFNHFDGRTHVMRFHPACGLWDMFVPGPGPGTQYRFEVTGADGARTQKIDPYGRAFVTPADSVAIVTADSYVWQDESWLEARRDEDLYGKPISIYEVHAGSWGYDGACDWARLSTTLLDYVVELGFTHIEFLPVSEHPFTGSWGYQPTGMFAPTARYGSPEAFKAFVDAAHQRGIGVLLDWVPAHFPSDAHGLVRFDGTALYEHEDPRRGFHPDWGTMIYNFGRAEVINFLVGSALYWLEAFHIDGLRVDAVASMLYLDYSREQGQWLPNVHGGRENLEAVAFLKRVNDAVRARFPGVMMIAEESTAWPGVTGTHGHWGLGFSYKWNMGWMHDSLTFIGKDPLYRRHHHDQITFSMVYAYSEQYVLPISHDEVVHGKGSLVGKMPGDDWQRLANVRAMLGYMWAHPGKKLLFMGSEFAQYSEWNHDKTLDWHLLGEPAHRGIQRLVSDLNRVMKDEPSLHCRDGAPDGFQWLIADDSTNSVLAFARHAPASPTVVA
ncbi:MAG: 1,4-alpha-glucan branching protein GlgB, partial [Pseudomonadales bacterium]|nr:1,4-alpha-glucan branching protein GlgB [Pseudomonadales bacterium]